MNVVETLNSFSEEFLVAVVFVVVVVDRMIVVFELPLALLLVALILFVVDVVVDRQVFVEYPAISEQVPVEHVSHP